MNKKTCSDILPLISTRMFEGLDSPMVVESTNTEPTSGNVLTYLIPC